VFREEWGGALGAKYFATGTVAHVAGGEDAAWRVVPGGALELCRRGACTRVDTDGVDASSMLFAREDNGRIGGRDAPSDEDRVKPSLEAATDSPVNAVWVHGMATSAFSSSSALVAYCQADPEPRCQHASLPGEDAFMKTALAVHRLERPVVQDILWLDVGDASAAFWWGPMAVGRSLVRCHAGPQTPPQCSLVDLP